MCLPRSDRSPHSPFCGDGQIAGPALLDPCPFLLGTWGREKEDGQVTTYKDAITGQQTASKSTTIDSDRYAHPIPIPGHATQDAMQKKTYTPLTTS